MAHKKSGGSTANGRDSNPKMRGVKRFGGELVETGMISAEDLDTITYVNSPKEAFDVLTKAFQEQFRL